MTTSSDATIEKLKQIEILNNSITETELKKYKVERYCYLIVCFASFIVSIIFSFIFLSNHEYKLLTINSIGSTGVLGVTLASFLTLVDKIHKHIEAVINIGHEKG